MQFSGREPCCDLQREPCQTFRAYIDARSSVGLGWGELYIVTEAVHEELKYRHFPRNKFVEYSMRVRSQRVMHHLTAKRTIVMSSKRCHISVGVVS